MRGNSGKNISSPGIAVPRIQMNTAKAHIHIAMRCELTAVFLYTISIGYLGEVQKAVALFTIFRGAKITEIFHASKYFANYLRTHCLFEFKWFNIYMFMPTDMSGWEKTCYWFRCYPPAFPFLPFVPTDGTM